MNFNFTLERYNFKTGKWENLGYYLTRAEAEIEKMKIEKNSNGAVEVKVFHVW